MKTPLEEVTIKCSECGDDATAAEINADIVRYHQVSGKVVGFPSIGLTFEDVEKIGKMSFCCECCQEDHDDR